MFKFKQPQCLLQLIIRKFIINKSFRTRIPNNNKSEITKVFRVFPNYRRNRLVIFTFTELGYVFLYH